MSSINEIIGAICYWYMRRTDPEWTKKKEEEYGLGKKEYQEYQFREDKS